MLSSQTVDEQFPNKDYMKRIGRLCYSKGIKMC